MRRTEGCLEGPLRAGERVETPLRPPEFSGHTRERSTESARGEPTRKESATAVESLDGEQSCAVSLTIRSHANRFATMCDRTVFLETKMATEGKGSSKGLHPSRSSQCRGILLPPQPNALGSADLCTTRPDWASRSASPSQRIRTRNRKLL